MTWLNQKAILFQSSLLACSLSYSCFSIVAITVVSQKIPDYIRSPPPSPYHLNAHTLRMNSPISLKMNEA